MTKRLFDREEQELFNNGFQNQTHKPADTWFFHMLSATSFWLYALQKSPAVIEWGDPAARRGMYCTAWTRRDKSAQ